MGPVLIGRAAERALVESFLDGVVTSAATLVIEGEPGIGKTALWRASVAAAESRGHVVLATAPAETEKSLSFAALTDLFGRVPSGVLDALPPPQRYAMDVVMLRQQVDADLDPRLVPTAVVTLLGALAGMGPVVVAVDDVQWLDRASMRALTFAARRTPTGVGWLLSRRTSPGGDDPFRGGTVERVGLVGLSLAAFHHLIAERLGQTLPRPVLARVHTAAGGNPLYGLELAGAVLSQPDHQLDDPLPVPARLQTLLKGRVRSLSDAARDVVLVAATLARPTTALAVAALGDRMRVEAGLREAADAGLLVEVEPRLRFGHPLQAAAVLASTSATRRQRVHRLLAHAVEDPEERAAHLAASTVGPDAQAALEIEDGARLAHRRAALNAAAELFAAAARLTPEGDGGDLSRRLLGAAAALHAAYDVEPARSFAQRALEAAPTAEQKTEALLLLSQLAWIDSPGAAAVGLLESALTQPVGDRRLLARVHGALASYQIGRAAVDHACRAGDLIDEDTDPGLAAYVAFNRFLGEAMLGHPPDMDLLLRGLELERRSGPDFEMSSIPLLWHQANDDFEAARSRVTAVEEWCVQRGEEARLAYEHAWLARVELRAGRWELAASLVDRSCGVLHASKARGAWSVPFGIRAYVDTHRGRFDRARHTLAPLVEECERSSEAWFATFFLFQQAFLEFSVGDHAAADRLLCRLAQHEATLGLCDSPGDRREPFHIESLVALGHVDRARDVLGQMERRASTWPRPNIAVSLPRARALVHSAEGDLAAALQELDHVDHELARLLPFEHAWNRLTHGRLLRRAKQKRAAAEALHEAAGVFADLGAASWVARARSELDRVEVRRTAGAELTATERQIAELTARGMTNRQVAAAVHVSPKTVEANLARIYHKLGIRSRAELGSMVGRPPSGA